MTHPPGQPGGSGGSSGGGTGPGRLTAFLNSVRAHRARVRAAAEAAGARATSARPLTNEARRDNYHRQNGTWTGGRLTARQRRRAEHKARHAAVRGTAA